MMLAGDELGRTQRGNNNAYCQDNEISWLDWSLLEKNADLFRFIARLIRFRKAHPSLRRRTFFEDEAGPPLAWHGAKLGKPDWDGESRASACTSPAADGDEPIYLVANAHWEPKAFELPRLPAGQSLAAVRGHEPRLRARTRSSPGRKCRSPAAADLPGGAALAWWCWWRGELDRCRASPRACRRRPAPLLLAPLAACGGSPRARRRPARRPAGLEPGFSLLRAAGRAIVNEAGETVRLRGVNLGGWLVKEGYILHFPGEALDAPSEIDRAILDLAGPEAGPQLLEEWREQWITRPTWPRSAALGFNSVRLPLHHALLWDAQRREPRADGFAFLDQVVGWCERNRLWLFLDLHCAPGGQNAGNISDSDGVARLYTEPANQDATVALWEAIANATATAAR